LSPSLRVELLMSLILRYKLVRRIENCPKPII
jgi:hypothetical protein